MDRQTEDIELSFEGRIGQMIEPFNSEFIAVINRYNAFQISVDEAVSEIQSIVRRESHACQTSRASGQRVGGTGYWMGEGETIRDIKIKVSVDEIIKP